MAETALNGARLHGHMAVPLAAQPPLLSTPFPRTPVPRVSWPASTATVPRANAPCDTRPEHWPPLPRGNDPVSQLASGWLAVLRVNGDLPSGGQDGVPMDHATARRILTEQSAVLIFILLSTPFQPARAAAVGHALVKTDFIGADVLGRSLRVLLLRLPELVADYARLPYGLDDLEQRVAAVTEALANGYVRALRDRTLAEQESMRAEVDAHRIISERLRHQATHDPLTGLPNRAAVFGRLAAATKARGGTRIGLCYLDLCGFKGVNDRYGHDAGDELLVTVAERIARVAHRYGALAGRIGGDEFVVLAESSPGVAGMIALAADILAEISRPVPLRIGRVCVSACAGIADRPAASPGAATIVADADAALYRAKSLGPGHWAVYDPARRQAS
jgi:diguanylate cyclase (GGDEF)-like protein